MLNEKLKLLNEVFGDYRKEGSEQYLFWCPNPKCNHHKRKFSINLNRGAKCWICDIHSFDIGFFIKRYGSFRQFERWQELSGKFDFSEKKDFSSLLKKKCEGEKKEIILQLPEEFRTLTGDISLSAKKPFNFLKNRGLTREDIFQWKIGYVINGNYENRIIIPSFNNDGNVNYFIARTYDEDWIKYLNPKIEHDIIFNELFINWKDDVILVEGVFDAIKAGQNSIPLLTSMLREGSVLFNKLIMRDMPVFIALDPDAGRKENKIIKLLMNYGIEVYKIDVEPFKDVGEMSKEEFRVRKENAKRINDIELFKRKIRL